MTQVEPQISASYDSFETSMTPQRGTEPDGSTDPYDFRMQAHKYRNNSVPDPNQHQHQLFNAPTSTHPQSQRGSAPQNQRYDFLSSRRASAFPSTAAQHVGQEPPATRGSGRANENGLGGLTSFRNPWNAGMFGKPQPARPLTQHTEGERRDYPPPPASSGELANGSVQSNVGTRLGSRIGSQTTSGSNSPTATMPRRPLKINTMPEGKDGSLSSRQHGADMRSVVSASRAGSSYLSATPYSSLSARSAGPSRSFKNIDGSFNAIELERSFRNFSFQGYDHTLDSPYPLNPAQRDLPMANLSRTGSSPGQTSMPGNVGWNVSTNGDYRSNSHGDTTGSADTASSALSGNSDQNRPLPQMRNLDHTASLRISGSLPNSTTNGNQRGVIQRRSVLDPSDTRGTFASHDSQFGSLTWDHRSLDPLQDCDRLYQSLRGSAPDLGNYSQGYSHSQDRLNGQNSPTYDASMNKNWPGMGLIVPSATGVPYIVDGDNSRRWRSALMDEFRLTNRVRNQWDLKMIYGHVVEFSGDQFGSRFLQDKLKTANSEEKDQVFQEILPNAIQLMKDVFGNYVLQKFFEHGDQTQKTALVNKMRGHMFDLSTQTYACRVVQKALAHILVEHQVDLMRELDGKIMDCIKCENGNHVIQVAIEQVPLEHIPFMVNAVRPEVEYLARHKYGCRVIQRLLEHAKEDVLFWLIPKLHECSNALIADQFGNYVPAHIVEKGSDQDRSRVIEVVKANLIDYSTQKFSSHVVEKCIRFGTPQSRIQFMQIFITPNERGQDPLEHLIRDLFANYVIQALMESLEPPDYLSFCQFVNPALQRAQNSGPSKQLDNVAKKMQNFYYHQYGPPKPWQPGPNGPNWNQSILV